MGACGLGGTGVAGKPPCISPGSCGHTPPGTTAYKQLGSAAGSGRAAFGPHP